MAGRTVDSGLVHIGAWEGSEYLSETRELLLFEPQGEAFRRLEANLGDRANATLVNVALGAKKGTAEMHLAGDCSSLLPPGKIRTLYPEVVFDGTETVRVSTLDREMKGREGFNEMVIDVQGYELEVLKGARRTLEEIERITAEINLDYVYEGCALVGEIDAYLKPFGFRRVKTALHSRGMCGDAIYAK